MCIVKSGKVLPLIATSSRISCFQRRVSVRDGEMTISDDTPDVHDTFRQMATKKSAKSVSAVAMAGHITLESLLAPEAGYPPFSHRGGVALLPGATDRDMRRSSARVSVGVTESCGEHTIDYPSTAGDFQPAPRGREKQVHIAAG